MLGINIAQIIRIMRLKNGHYKVDFRVSYEVSDPLIKGFDGNFSIKYYEAEVKDLMLCDVNNAKKTIENTKVYYGNKLICESCLIEGKLNRSNRTICKRNISVNTCTKCLPKPTYRREIYPDGLIVCWKVS